MCKSICEAILGVILVVFALVPALWTAAFSKWVVLIVGVVLLIHSFTCKKCFASMPKRR